MIFFLNKNTDFCWEKVKIFKSWGVRTPSPPPRSRGRHIPGTSTRTRTKSEEYEYISNNRDQPMADQESVHQVSDNQEVVDQGVDHDKLTVQIEK